MSHKPVVLVVDDEAVNFDVIEILLFREGYDLHYRNSGKSAIAELSEIKPDIIMLDVMMPEMDGIEVCQQIKNLKQWQHIPIIIITALSDKEDLARCLDIGADDFISKPINSAELRARTRSMLRIKFQHDRIQETMRSHEEMMQTIVHDLRNPLVGILLGCESLKSLDMSAKALQRIDRISKTADQMHHLIDDILTIGRIEANKLVLDLTELDLVEIIKSVTVDFEAIALSREVQLLSEFSVETARIFGDIHIVRRLISNLIDNAIKFSPQKSSIIIKVDRLPENSDRGDLIKIQVIDCGSGVSPEQTQVIFKKYEVGDILVGVSQIGLGLSFCKMAVEAHNGSISVTNNHSEGSIFTVFLDHLKD